MRERTRRSRDPPTVGLGPTIASRVSSSQAPLALAWQTNRAVSGRPLGRSNRAGDRARRLLSRASPVRRPPTSGIEDVAEAVAAVRGLRGECDRPPSRGSRSRRTVAGVHVIADHASARAFGARKAHRRLNGGRRLAPSRIDRFRQPVKASH